MEASFYKHITAKPLPSDCVTPAALDISIQGDNVTIVLTDLNIKYNNPTGDYLTKEETLLCLEWLASFHAHFWNREEDIEGLWEQGSYWHLDTRLDEYNSMKDDIWKKNAARLGDILKGYPDGDRNKERDRRYRTIIHGDMKAENILFSEDKESCSVCDFQYVGQGYGMVDVAYLLSSSVNSSLLSMDHLHILMDHYHHNLIKVVYCLICIHLITY